MWTDFVTAMASQLLKIQLRNFTGVQFTPKEQKHTARVLTAPFVVHTADTCCSASLNGNHVIKIADDTTVAGLVTNNDESA